MDNIKDKNYFDFLKGTEIYEDLEELLDEETQKFLQEVVK
jgi:hypothetical protein